MILSEFIFLNSFDFLRPGPEELDLSEAVSGSPASTIRTEVLNVSSRY